MIVQHNMFIFSLPDVRRDLVSRLYQVAYTLEAVRGGRGASFLGLGDALPLDWPSVDDYDLALQDLDRGLASLYRYGAFGEDDGIAIREPAIESESHLGRLRLILDWSKSVVVDSTSHWLEGELGIQWDSKALEQLVALVGAREALDAGGRLPLAWVALLAGVDERTLRNATHAQGEVRLSVDRLADGSTAVDAGEALRWLCRRPGFAPTTWVGSSHQGPDGLSRPQLRAYLERQRAKHFPDTIDLVQSLAWTKGLSAEPARTVPGSGVSRLEARMGWPDGQWSAWLAAGPEPLPSAEIIRLALALGIDRRWLSRHLGGPGSAKAEVPPLRQVFDEAAGAVTVTLTAAGIANGYLDIPTRYAERLFPPDAFGGRAADARGAPVTLIVDGETFDSDIRRQSKAMTSPRKRFNGWFRRHQAQPGDTVRIEREAERRFVLHLIPATPLNAQ